MSLADYVRILGRGPGRSRSLTREEAYSAMTLMLRDDADGEAVGAVLMLLRMKGETAEEIAGFAAAARAALSLLPPVDLDWPSYAAGRTRGAPWFLMSAKEVAEAGHRVLLHGWNGADLKVRTGLRQAGIPMTTSIYDAAMALDTGGIAYIPLETLQPGLLRLLALRDVLGLRSCVNTVCRMLNPAGAASSVQGVFHPSYRMLQADAAAHLAWQNLTVIKGGGGEFERNPSKECAAFGLRKGEVWEAVLPAMVPSVRRLADPTGLHFSDRWFKGTPDGFEQAIIHATTAAALDTLAQSAPDTETAA